MKIIGQASADGRTWIVEATDHELARVAGCAYPLTYREKGGRFAINAEIEVSRLFERLEGIRACERRLTEAQNTLRVVADLIGPVADCVAFASSLQEGDEP